MAGCGRRKNVAVLAGESLPTVDRWVDRYANNGLAGLEDGSHATPREQVPAAVRARISALTRATPPVEDGYGCDTRAVIPEGQGNQTLSSALISGLFYWALRGTT
jgi:hypothetical protein